MKTSINNEQFKEYMAILEEHYRCGVNNSVSEELVKMRRLGYWEMLKECDVVELRTGVINAISTLKFLPSARDLKELCYGGKSDELRAFEKNNKAAKIAGYLQGRDDSLELKLNIENWNLIPLAYKCGISKAQILDCVKNGRSLKEIILAARNPQIDADNYKEICGDLFSGKRAATADDYKEIARNALQTWKEEGLA